VAIELVVIVELQEQLLARERKLDERENTLLAKEHGNVKAERALMRARMECDATLDRARVIKKDYHARLHTSTTGWWFSPEFDRVLSRHRYVLSVQETDLQRRDKELADDQGWDLHPPDKWDLPSKLGKLREHMAEVEDDHIVEDEQLSWSMREISNAFVDLIVLPIQGIPLQPRSVKDVMAMFDLVLECLCKEVPVHEPDA
jgi:hypothetical protein